MRVTVKSGKNMFWFLNRSLSFLLCEIYTLSGWNSPSSSVVEKQHKVEMFISGRSLLQHILGWNGNRYAAINEAFLGSRVDNL